MVVKDLLEIRVHNSYGDTFERELENPTCEEVIAEFVSISQQLGYPLGCIYAALMNEAESMKEQIFAAHEHVKEFDSQKQ